ncbi:MAG TPA: glycoside hydrolase family 2 TIM barrel-domain containing protein [Polyangiaceae bacterium]|nr:glycoside hydrolase family 2 TIM barrel-domain containing protein [Polyangiaceae bacterium]
MLRRTLLHDGWQLACSHWLVPPARLGYSELDWLPARVPGHVHTDLVEAGVIADPFARRFELGCQWVDGERWVYRTHFDFTPDAALPRRLLHFDGLDTVASVWLDGQKLAEHDDMFVPLELDVTERLAPGRHELRVEFEPAVSIGRQRRARYLASEGLRENVVRFDEQAFVRKAQYMYGWDWGPRLVSAGIWRPVTLVEHAGRLLDVLVEQTHLAGGAVELRLWSDVDGDGVVEHAVEGVPGVFRDGEAARLERAELWWPAGLGAQRLFRVTSRLVGAERRVLDERTTRVGLRRVRLVREPDAHGESFELEVNGERVYCVGANWIPDDSFPARVSEARTRERLAQARELNMNMVRVWGGGLYESDDFYAACDELGMLVWQDFPYACSYYPEDPDSLKAARREARENVRRLRNHPSLVLWCGNNENRTMFESGWDDPKRHPPRYYGERIYEGVLPQVLAELDPTRPYVPTSPWGGARANDGGTGDQHYWDVWHGRGDYRFYADSKARFASEFGFASAPGPRVWAKIAQGTASPLELPVRDANARWHDKTLKGYETFVGFVELHYPPATNLEEWTYFSQLNQRDALRFGIEHFRRSDFCKGALIWQLNDCWPAQSWAVLDAEGEAKAAAFELRRLFAPALASLVVEAGNVTLFAVLDNATAPCAARAVLEARSLVDGRVLARRDLELTLAPRERRLALELDVSGWDPRETFVTGTFAESATARLLCEPKDARVAKPRLEARPVAGGVLLASDAPVLDLFLWDPTGETRLTDNFVTLVEAGTRFVRTAGPVERLRGRSLAGAHSIAVEA